MYILLQKDTEWYKKDSAHLANLVVAENNSHHHYVNFKQLKRHAFIRLAVIKQQ